MKVDKSAMLLYIVSDRTWLKDASLKQQIEQSVKAGVTFVQLREKEMLFDEFVKEALEMKEITDQYKIPFVINDNVQVALAANADGVHIGQGDMEVTAVRKLIGKDKILGVSAQTVEQAVKAEQDGADYIGVGAVFQTSTKLDANSVSYETLQAICKSVMIPVVAIGGIHEKNIMKLKGSGVDGVAVISAILAKPDIYAATKELLAHSKEMVKG